MLEKNMCFGIYTDISGIVYILQKKLSAVWLTSPTEKPYTTCITIPARWFNQKVIASFDLWQRVNRDCLLSSIELLYRRSLCSDENILYSFIVRKLWHIFETGFNTKLIPSKNKTMKVTVSSVIQSCNGDGICM